MAMVSGPSGNTTIDIWRSGGGAAAFTGVACKLLPDWGSDRSDRRVSALRFTHIAEVGLTVDIRDGYTGADGLTAPDTVYVPQTTDGTPFTVIFVERLGYGTPNDLKRVYLERATPPWPTNNL